VGAADAVDKLRIRVLRRVGDGAEHRVTGQNPSLDGRAVIQETAQAQGHAALGQQFDGFCNVDAVAIGPQDDDFHRFHRPAPAAPGWSSIS